NGLTVHMLEAGFENAGRPTVLLLHGFPELAYSWRKVMLPLAAAGYHVVAPDMRGFGRTLGWDDSFEADPDQFRILNMVRDTVGPPLDNRQRGARAGLAGSGVGGAGAARRLPSGGAVELPICRSPRPAVQHSERRSPAAPGGDRRRSRR